MKLLSRRNPHKNSKVLDISDIKLSLSTLKDFQVLRALRVINLITSLMKNNHIHSCYFKNLNKKNFFQILMLKSKSQETLNLINLKIPRI